VPTPFQGAIFDVDGVLVDSPHQKAWRESLRELMEGEWGGIRDQATWSPEAFTPHVYQEVMSGKPRMSGARAALEYFKVPDVDARAGKYAARKQAMVVRLIEAGEFTAYPDALRFIIAVKDAGIQVAAASSSKNAQLFLRRIRLDTFAQEHGICSPSLRRDLTLLDFFDADVSGRDFTHGKPHPEMFLTAAHELGAAPEATIAGMTYYDTVLAAWLTGPAGQALAKQSLALSHEFNGLLSLIYRIGGFRVADVAGAFSTDDMTTLVNGVPLDVVRICQWTWMCAPAPLGPDIHANQAGYGVIAQAFAAVL